MIRKQITKILSATLGIAVISSTMPAMQAKAGDLVNSETGLGTEIESDKNEILDNDDTTGDSVEYKESVEEKEEDTFEIEVSSMSLNNVNAAAAGEWATDVSLNEYGDTCEINGFTFKNIYNPAWKQTVQLIAIDKSVGNDVDIPAYITCNNVEYSVYSIDLKAFAGNKELKSITIPKTTHDINYASVSLGECEKLENIFVQDGSDYFISDGGILYKGSNNDKDLKLAIYPPAKKGSEYKIKSEATDMSLYAFRGNQYLKKVTFPEQFKGEDSSLSASYFDTMKSIEEVVINNDSYSVEKGIVYDNRNDEKIAIYCPPKNKLENYELADGTTEIEKRAFKDCINMKNMFIPDTVKRISSYAFEGCSSLRTLELPEGIVIDNGLECAAGALFCDEDNFIYGAVSSNDSMKIGPNFGNFTTTVFTYSKDKIGVTIDGVLEEKEPVVYVYVPSKIRDTDVVDINKSAFDYTTFKQFIVDDDNVEKILKDKGIADDKNILKADKINLNGVYNKFKDIPPLVDVWTDNYEEYQEYKDLKQKLKDVKEVMDNNNASDDDRIWAYIGVMQAYDLFYKIVLNYQNSEDNIRYPYDINGLSNKPKDGSNNGGVSNSGSNSGSSSSSSSHRHHSSSSSKGSSSSSKNNKESFISVGGSKLKGTELYKNDNVQKIADNSLKNINLGENNVDSISEINSDNFKGYLAKISATDGEVIDNYLYIKCESAKLNTLKVDTSSLKENAPLYVYKTDNLGNVILVKELNAEAAKELTDGLEIPVENGGNYVVCNNKLQEKKAASSESSSITNGWKNVNGNWIHMKDGQAEKGWIKDNNKWYYLNSAGIMQKGWIKDGSNKWYYLDDSGAMKTGWFKDSDANWYYLKEDGSMASNETIDGYEVDSHGVWVK